MAKKFDWRAYVADVAYICDDYEDFMRFLKEFAGDWVMYLDGKTKDEIIADGYCVADAWCIEK